MGSYEKTQHVPMKGDLEEASRLDSPLNTRRPVNQKIDNQNILIESPQMNAEEQ